MSILKSVRAVNDRAIEHDIKLNQLVLRLDQVKKMYDEITYPLGDKPSLDAFLHKEHYMHDGIHLMWTRPI